MFRILSGFFSTIGLILFIIWSVLPADPSERFERGCKPIQWVGGAGVAVMEIVHKPWAKSVQNAVDKTDYTCRYTLWSLFYKKEYQQWKALQDYRQEEK
ncbi:hypothetical protein [Galenea microaerophila]